MGNSDEQIDWKLRLMILGGSISQMITVLAQLGIADLIKNKTQKVEKLAEITKVDTETLYRLLRVSASLGIFSEERPREFVITPLSELLCSDITGSLRNYAILKGQSWARQALISLDQSIKTGIPAFNQMFDKGIFDYLEENEGSNLYHRSLKDISRYHDPFIIKSYDFTNFSTVADIGAGMGTLLTTILEKYSHLKGIHFDKISASETAKQHNAKHLVDRCQFISGNFFSGIPGGADVYILKTILHDWNDIQAKTILNNIYKKIPKNGKVLIIEIIMPDGNEIHPRTVMDLEMLIFYGGKERTLLEYNDLLKSTGFRIDRVLPTDKDVSILECSPVDKCSFDYQDV
jgi:hypothetical protein